MVGADRHHIAHPALADAAAQLTAAVHFIAGAAPPQRGKRAETTLERWQQVHDLLGKGTGLMECARRLDLSLKRSSATPAQSSPSGCGAPLSTRPTLVNPYRDHLRKRRAGDPAVPVQRLLREIRELGYQAARTCSSGTSPRAAPRPTGRTCHPFARPVPARRPAPRDTGPHTGRVRLGYDRARVLLKKHTDTASGRGLDLHQLRHSAATHLRDQKSPSS